MPVAVEGELAAGLTGEQAVPGQVITDNRGSIRLFPRTSAGWTAEAHLVARHGDAEPARLRTAS